MPVTFWIAGAIVAVLVLRRFSSIAASCLGLSLTVVLAVWGTMVYGDGGGLAFAGQRLPREAFYALIAVWFGIEIFTLIREVQRRRSSDADD